MRNISISSYYTYANCGRRWKFQYEDKIRKPTTSPHLIFGSAIHKAIEDLSLSIAHKHSFSLSQMNDSFQESWKQGIETNEIVWMNKTQANKMFGLGLELISQYYKEFSGYKPLMYEDENGIKPAVELYFNAPIIKEDGSIDQENQFSGIIDLIAEDNRGNVIVFDHKTSSDPYSDFQIQTNLQLVLYAYAYRHLFKQGKFPLGLAEKEDSVCFNVLVKKYRVEPWIEQQKRIIYQADINNLMEEIREYIRSIDSNIFIPNRGSHCDNSFVGCDYKEECLLYDGSRKSNIDF